jgi:hypothetical protein
MDKFKKYSRRLDAPGAITTVDREVFDYWLNKVRIENPKGEYPEARAFGLAVDSLKKQQAVDTFGARISEPFAPFDYLDEVVRYDIKSSSTGYFTVSNAERNYIRGCYRDDELYGFQLYVNDLTELTSTFIGTVNACMLEDLGLIKLSQYKGWELQPNNEWVQNVTWYVSLDEIKKHLT